MRFRPVLFVVLGVAAATAVACGSGQSEHDQAIDALERATQASNLESEMAALVEDVPVTTAGTESRKFKDSVDDLDTEAETLLASADTGQEYDEKISASVEETRGAGTDLAAAVGKPEAVGPARKKAVGRLTSSNESLGQATQLIGTDLADENGELSAEDSEALEQTLTAVDDSAEAVASAEESLVPTDCSIGGSGPAAWNLDSFSVEVQSGAVTCEEAKAVFQRYYDSGTYAAGTSGGAPAQIGEWFCDTESVVDMVTPQMVFSTCTRDSDGARIITRIPDF